MDNKEERRDALIKQVDNKEERRDAFIKQKEELEKQKSRYTRMNKNSIFAIIIAIVILVLALRFINQKYSYSINSREPYLFSMVAITYACMMIFYVITISGKNNDRISYIEANKERIDEELELLEISNITVERRAEKQFKQHQKELNRYYNENIRQMRGVYNIGLFTIVSGLLLIVGTIILCVYKPELTKNYIMPVMGIVSGLASSFIGTLFIKMYTETINTSSKFHDKLVYSNNLHFNNFLISKIDNKDKKEDAIFEIVKLISSNKDITNI